MDRRITCITLFENNDLRKINNIVSLLDEKLNKVPIHIENRENVDILPYHITLSTWDITEKEKVIELLKTIPIKNIVLEINDIKIKQYHKGYSNSYNLYFSVKENQEIYEIQKYIYSKLPSEKYDPDKFTLHISIHSDNNYEKLLKMQKKILKNFQSFKVEFKELGLYEIYPAKRIL